MRLDRWLWAARFFKTRAMAAAAVRGGKVHLGGERVKCGRRVSVGHRLEITRGHESIVVDVIGLCDRRRPAKEAQSMYAETPESARLRQQEADLRRTQSRQFPDVPHRPDKRQRRQLRQLSGKA